jgi:Flp pilus assembly protein TadD
MARALGESKEDEAEARPVADDSSAYIADVYFAQATSLLNQGMHEEAEAYFREVIRIRPDHAETLNNLGTAVWRQGRSREAERYYRRAQAIAPDDFAVLNNLGNVFREQGRLKRAVRLHRKAVELQPDSSRALMNLGVTLSELGDFDEALGWLRKSLQVDPGFADCHVNLGMTLARQGNLDEALLCYEEALRLRPDFPEARRNRAHIWLARGDFARGWPEYEWRLQCPKFRTLPVNRPRWTGEDLAGRSVLIHAEQGLGDTLQFIRFAIAARERRGRVVVACPQPLVRLLSRCPAIDLAVDWMEPLPDCNAQIPLLSLPSILGITTDTFAAAVPYLSADADSAAAWRTKVAQAIGRRPEGTCDDPKRPSRIVKIGIAWQGSRGHPLDRWRSFPLSLFVHLAALPGVQLISLQKGDGVAQLARLAGRFPVIDLNSECQEREALGDLLDTAAVMSGLDLVVTTDSAVAHLAGGLGVKAWVALSTVGEWRWLIDREDSAWYPTMRLFRQASFGDWDGVFRRMASALSHELASIDGSAGLPTKLLDRVGRATR